MLWPRPRRTVLPRNPCTSRQTQKISTPCPWSCKTLLIQNLRQELAKVEAEYQENYTTFKDDYPKLKNMKAKMQDIERRIAAEENRILATIKNDYLSAQAKESSLAKKAEDMKRQALDLNNQATEYKILEREVETSKFIHQSLMERSKEIDAKVGTDLGNVQVVDYAVLPLTPYKPNIRLNLLAGRGGRPYWGSGTGLFPRISRQYREAHR